jgi:hypothetical protein
MPYGADEVWPSAVGVVMTIAKSDLTQRVLIIFEPSDDKFKVVTELGTILESPVQSFVANDWVDLVVTMNYAANEFKLYLDGILVDTDTTAHAVPTNFQEWRLGSYTGGTCQAGAIYAELSAFDKVLDTVEIKQLFNLQQPLADSGASDTPGVFIVDGNFQLASSATGERVEITAEGVHVVGSTGEVFLDEDGLMIEGVQFGSTGSPNQLSWRYDDAGTWKTLSLIKSEYIVAQQSSSLWLQAQRSAGQPWTSGAQINLVAVDGVGGTDVRLNINSNQTIDVQGSLKFTVNNMLRPGIGAADPAVGVENGCLFYRTDINTLRLRAGGVWTSLAEGVTDHGALTGLGDDDHGQYLRTDGTRTGATASDQKFTNDVRCLRGLVVGEDIDGEDNDVSIAGSVIKSTALGCRVYNSNVQTIFDTTTTILNFSAEQWDTDTCWAAGADSNKLFAKHAGYYIIAGNVSWEGSVTGRRNFAILDKNGNNLVAFSTWPGDATLCHQFAMTGMFYMAVNDYVQFQVWQNSGGALDIQARTTANQNYCTCWLTRVA